MKNILKKIKDFILSEQFVVIFTICYILIIGIILTAELRQSSLNDFYIFIVGNFPKIYVNLA